MDNLQMLYFANETDPIILRVDASKDAIGGHLAQLVTENGKIVERTVGFASRTFSAAEKRWHIQEKECFAGYYCITQEWDHLLRGRPFVLETDHSNLTYIANSPSAKVVRWKIALSQYDCVVRHIPGSKNIVADAGS
jgi:hypothetical protein